MVLRYGFLVIPPEKLFLNGIVSLSLLSRKYRAILSCFVYDFFYNTPPGISKELRKSLINIFEDDILKLQDLINVDLSRW